LIDEFYQWNNGVHNAEKFVADGLYSFKCE
jgi:hypothetical protein